jgi:cellulose synthase/poly-beta-1,6-N-acetylglucosamine synthase-like glycosyltransferase
MSLLDAAVLGLYLATLALLALFGLHRSAMVYLYFRHRSRRVGAALPTQALPRVTVQLPIFNEIHVLDRLLESVARIRYPKELLQIQILDDSSDETAPAAARAVERLRASGFDAQCLHRDARTGFKAGALAAGLEKASGELLLVFDADFVAPPEILERTVGHFADPRIGMVQVRWGHVNRDHSLLTRVQSILLDAHFVLEHGGRSRSGRFFNFNGTAGIWRKTAIVDAGGWQHDTLTEDLDLSYRAQLRGWRFLFVPEVVAPAEVPVEMSAFHSQQHRWAKGSVQTCRKLLPRILSARLPLAVRIESAFHLTANFSYPLMVLLSLLMFPATIIRHESGLDRLALVDVPLFACATLSVCAFYLVGQREIAGRAWRRRVKDLPAVLAVGIGLSVNNARAVLEALLGRESAFARTPKYGVVGKGDDWRGKRYRESARLPLLELLLACNFAVMLAYALNHHLWATLPFAALFLGGFLHAVILWLVQDALRPRPLVERLA